MFLGLALTCVFSAHGQTTVGTRADIEAVYRQFSSCWERKDVSGLAKLMHPSGFTISPDGSRWSFARARKDFTPMFAALRKLKLKIVLDQVTFSGAEAQVWLHSWSSQESLAMGKWTRETGRGWFFETVRKFPEGWRIVESVVLTGDPGKS